MNFTREPIIETIISPKGGYKLVVRSSSVANHEEYSVDAVEVVSFGKSFFFRSLERPKSFLLPVGDYEVVEVKESRMVLKKVTVEKSIKIIGEKAPRSSTNRTDTSQADSRKKQDRKKPRKTSTEGPLTKERRASEKARVLEEGMKKGEADVASSEFKSLLSPPPRLISENMGRYKSNLLTKTTDSSKGVDLSQTSQVERGVQEDANIPMVLLDEEVKKKGKAAVSINSFEKELPFATSFNGRHEKDRDILNEEVPGPSLEDKPGEGYSIE